MESLRREAAKRVDRALWQPAHSYYRTSEHKASLFVGALAGDWFARYAGLPPVLPVEQARAHLRLQQRAAAPPASAGQTGAVPLLGSAAQRPTGDDTHDGHSSRFPLTPGR